MKLDGEKLVSYLARQKENIKLNGTLEGADDTQVKLMTLILDDLLSRICRGDYTIDKEGEKRNK